MKPEDTDFAERFFEYINSPESREDHRRDYNDREWKLAQREGKPLYKLGDVIEFQVGGFGVISNVNRGNSPTVDPTIEFGVPSYAVNRVEGMEYHAGGIVAWHYEGDIKTCIARSPLHDMEKELQSPNLSRSQGG